MVTKTNSALSEENLEDAKNLQEVKLPMPTKALPTLQKEKPLWPTSEKLAESPDAQKKLLLKEEEVAHPKPWNTLVTKPDLAKKEVHAVA